MISFNEARRAVLSKWPDYKIAGHGYETDAHWLLVLLPETMGGRVPAVDKATGSISWINENSEMYAQDRLVGTP